MSFDIEYNDSIYGCLPVKTNTKRQKSKDFERKLSCRFSRVRTLCFRKQNENVMIIRNDRLFQHELAPSIGIFSIMVRSGSFFSIHTILRARRPYKYHAS